jgi:NAD(P) transhydrogenase
MLWYEQLFCIISDQEKVPKGRPYNEVTIGVPKEIQVNERRVGLTPDAAKTLIKNGFNIIVEEGAGVNAQFKDSDYLEAGAQVKPLKEMYNNSDIIIKVFLVNNFYHKLIITLLIIYMLKVEF